MSLQETPATVAQPSAAGSIEATDHTGICNPRLLFAANMLCGMALGAIAVLLIPQYKLDWSTFSMPTLARIGQAAQPTPTVQPWLPTTSGAPPLAAVPNSAIDNLKPSIVPDTAPTAEDQAVLAKYRACMTQTPPRGYVMHWAVAQGHKDPWVDSKCVKVRLRR